MELSLGPARCVLTKRARAGRYGPCHALVTSRVAAADVTGGDGSGDDSGLRWLRDWGCKGSSHEHQGPCSWGGDGPRGAAGCGSSSAPRGDGRSSSLQPAVGLRCSFPACFRKTGLCTSAWHVWLPSAPLTCEQRPARAPRFCAESTGGLGKSILENAPRSSRGARETKQDCGTSPSPWQNHRITEW